uniref:Gfo/Idh/MocA family oxidoreductase n=1 Tax=Strongyloides papillosus TaxID=174720 RepID=A0A0N5BRN9_STREA
EYEKILPVLPLIYEQNIYDQSSFSKVDMSLMHTECEAVGYHTVHTLGDILLDQSTGTTIETRFRFYDTELCGINMPTYENSFSKDVFLIKPKNLQLNDADHKILMDIYRYHHGFNETCPNADEAEMEIETGRIVPRLPVLRKRAFIDADILDRILTNSRQRESETVSTRTKEMEASLAALNRDYVTA